METARRPGSLDTLLREGVSGRLEQNELEARVGGLPGRTSVGLAWRPTHLCPWCPDPFLLSLCPNGRGG